jgi:hypothetical protein
MDEHQHEADEPVAEKASGYQAPVVEDLESLDGPAVTAALKSTG